MKTRRRALYIVALIAFSLFAAFVWAVVAPSEIDPVAWTPPEPPGLRGPYAENDRLTLKLYLADANIVGPEDVTRDAQGRFYTGVADGRIIRFTLEGAVETFVNTGGRPLGLEFDGSGNLIVCDAHKGLLSVAPDGAITTLATEHDGVPFGFTDDLDIARDGTIYFTDATWKFHAPNYRADLMEHRGNGRFLRYEPATRKTALLIGDLCFANGVALSEDESFVLVNETWSYRVLRYWLAGEKKGTSDVFIDNLPGFPDNISWNGQDTFWLALANPRNGMVDALAPYPRIRRVFWRLPEVFLPAAVRHSFVLGLDSSGKVVHNLQRRNGELAPVTSANQFDNLLVLGSVEDPRIGVYTLPDAR